MSFFRYFFPRPSKIIPGSFWVMEDDYDNPFEQKIVFKVEAVKNGWVKYTIYGCSTGFVRSESKRISSFYGFYREIKELPENFHFLKD